MQIPLGEVLRSQMEKRFLTRCVTGLIYMCLGVGSSIAMWFKDLT